MTAYIAVIKDSFREAFASRVLWILLALITLALLGLTPLGWNVLLTSTIRSQDVRDFTPLRAQLVERGASEDDDDTLTKQQHIWQQLSTELRERLTEQHEAESAGKDRRSLQRDLIEEFNRLVTDDKVYDSKLWQAEDLNEEGRRLADEPSGELSDMERRRLNYLALHSAYPGLMRRASDTSIMLHYLHWDFGEPIPISEEQLRVFVSLIIADFAQLLVGRLGIFAAILVTASIIPNVSDTGSVNLLLSKPISRPLLFLAKFVGGCWFVLIIGAYLVTGVWLIVGARLGIWNHNLLWCIPVFLFLFAVYYSVSAVSGLIWRNTIVCVVMTIIFWFVCTIVASTKQTMEMFLIQPNRIKQLALNSDLVFAVTERGQLLQWDTQGRIWTDRYQLEGANFGPAMRRGPQLIGPIYDRLNERLVFVQNQWGQSKTFTAKKDDQWQAAESVSAPPGTLRLLTEQDGRLLFLSQQGLFRLADDAKPVPKDKQVEILGFKIPLGQKDEPYQKIVQDRSVEFGPDCAAAMAGNEDVLYHWCSGKLTRLSPTEDGQYSPDSSKKIGDNEQSAVLAASGNHVVVALDDGAVVVLDGANFAEVARFRPDGQNQPRFATASEDGRWFAVVYHTGKLWVFDSESQQEQRISGIDQGEVSAVSLSEAGKLHVADRGKQVTVIELPTGDAVATFAAPLDTWRKIYYYAVVPLHTIFPKPGELENTVNYLLSGRETVTAGPPGSGLGTMRIKADPWTPVWSSLAFTVVVLAFGCYYVKRQEF